VIIQHESHAQACTFIYSNSVWKCIIIYNSLDIPTRPPSHSATSAANNTYDNLKRPILVKQPKSTVHMIPEWRVFMICGSKHTMLTNNIKLCIKIQLQPHWQTRWSLVNCWPLCLWPFGPTNLIISSLYRTAT